FRRAPSVRADDEHCTRRAAHLLSCINQSVSSCTIFLTRGIRHDSIRHEARRCSQTGSRDAGSDAYPRRAQRTGWRKSRGRGAIFKDQSPDDIRMAGAISARWVGSVEGQAVVWKTAQTECTSYAMGLQDRDREESVATEVCVRAVDARHGGQADPG